jgi:hypothetical protein
MRKIIVEKKMMMMMMRRCGNKIEDVRDCRSPLIELFIASILFFSSPRCSMVGCRSGRKNASVCV